MPQVGEAVWGGRAAAVQNRDGAKRNAHEKSGGGDHIAGGRQASPTKQARRRAAAGSCAPMRRDYGAGWQRGAATARKECGMLQGGPILSQGPSSIFWCTIRKYSGSFFSVLAVR